MMERSIRFGALALALAVAGCVAAGNGGGYASGNQIVVSLDPSIPDLAAATIVAERDCTARGGQAYLLSSQASGASRTATFACDPIRRQSGGGNDSRS